jgi:DedD protein
LSEPLSNTHLKYRLLGAGILVLLAVILIPLFLGEPKYVTEEVETPKSAEFESKIQPLPGSVQITEEPMQAQKNDITNSDGLVLKKLDNDQPVKSENSKQVTIQPLQLNNVTSESSRATEKSVAKQQAPKSKAVTQKAVPVKSKPQVPELVETKIKSGWAVQAGIFSKTENARAIAEILKNNGYAPNISDAKASFGKVKRVWIGPFASKTEAQAVSKRLEQQTGEGGYVATYPFKS